ncbi:hypothetical protein [Paraburkholderia sp. BL18I3N2]|uniref:hypothetical protein n=1 Tax=Paraburkholderia sp. BL18I3N2 TaxID=1938799 RepID=UPI0011B25C5F|nr:hypothetical protein [Paraburkholderia sp. BL18I3N2]
MNSQAGSIAEATVDATEPHSPALTKGRMTANGRRSLDSIRPRVLGCKDLLRDAKNESLSPHTRYRLALECMYLCCVEVVEAEGVTVDDIAHPSFKILDVAIPALQLPDRDSVTVDLLLYWSQRSSPFVPAVPVTDVCDLAERIYDAMLCRIGFV